MSQGYRSGRAQARRAARADAKAQGGFPYVWTRDRLGPQGGTGWRGKRCRKIGKVGPAGTVSVQFEDGSRWRVAVGGLRRA